MKKDFGLSLRRFALGSTAALIALMLAGAARADTVFPYLVDGTARNESGGSLGSCAFGAICPFSGRLLINPVAGTLDALSITFPGFSTFDRVVIYSPTGPLSGILGIHSSNAAGDSLFFDFHTTQVMVFPEHHEILATLVGFQGAEILGGEVSGQYNILNGDITVVPEPSSLALLGTGLLCCLGFALMRCRSETVI